MKNVINRPAILLLSVLFTMAGCSKSQTVPDQAVSTSTANTNIATTVVSGAWTISSFGQRNEDKTSLFNGYVFTFASGGSVRAEKNGTVTTGTWLYTPSAVGYYGSTPSKSSLTINMGTTTPLSQLSRTWNVDSTNTSSSRLALVNPEVLENMRIDFSRH